MEKLLHRIYHSTIKYGTYKNKLKNIIGNTYAKYVCINTMKYNRNV